MSFLKSISNLQVILVQIEVFFGKPQENFNNITNILNGITFGEENSLIMLPELFATGYDLQAIKEHAQPLIKSDSVKFLSSLALKHKSYVYGSVPEKDSDKTFNTAVLISPDGKILGSYRKIHLFRPLQEHVAFLPGNATVNLSTDLGPVGLSICYDLRFAEVYVNQRNNGTKIFLLCAEWPIPRIQHWTTLIKARAIEHQALIIAVNRVGQDPTGIYGGNSLIVAPDGEVLFQANELESVSKIMINIDEKLNIPFLFNIKQEKRL